MTMIIDTRPFRLDMIDVPRYSGISDNRKLEFAYGWRFANWHEAIHPVAGNGIDNSIAIPWPVLPQN
jgi:hypothetical protein